MTFPRHSATCWRFHVVVLQPRAGRNQPGLGSSPFARHYLGNHCYFLFLRVLRCFSSPGSPSSLRIEYLVFNQVGCPIRKSADQRVCAPSHRLSQLITSFIASESLGIPRAPFVTSVSNGRLRVISSLSFARVMPSSIAGSWHVFLLFASRYVKERVPDLLSDAVDKLASQLSESKSGE